MEVRKGTIVVRGSDVTHSFRVEGMEGNYATIRSLKDYMRAEVHVNELAVQYHPDTFDPGDTVRIRREYVDRYNEADGENELKVIQQKKGELRVTVVEDNIGHRFNILNERLYLVKPAKEFKAGDRVVVDLDLAKKFDYDGDLAYYQGVGVLVLTEDSGSRAVKYTSHVRFEERDGNYTHNVPTRWLKLYEEPAKRVVGETIKAKDIKVGDKVKASYPSNGCQHEITGVVMDTYNLGTGFTVALGSSVFLSESNNLTFVLLEEAPEPVDENLQRLLDAEVGDIAFGTYADEYWKKIGEDKWRLIRDADSQDMVRNSEEVFSALYKLKYGELFFYKKVEDGGQ